MLQKWLSFPFFLLLSISIPCIGIGSPWLLVVPAWIANCTFILILSRFLRHRFLFGPDFCLSFFKFPLPLFLLSSSISSLIQLVIIMDPLPFEGLLPKWKSGFPSVSWVFFNAVVFEGIVIVFLCLLMSWSPNSPLFNRFNFGSVEVACKGIYHFLGYLFLPLNFLFEFVPFS